MKVYKYQVENELAQMKPIDRSYFGTYLDRISLKKNKIILFKNRKENTNTYYCTNCKKWHVADYKKIEKIKLRDTFKCENCNHWFYTQYYHNVLKDQKYYITLIDSNERNELILRIFCFKKIYKAKEGLFDENIIEVERINLDRKICVSNRNTYKPMGSYGELYHRFLDLGWKRDKAGYHNYYNMDLVYKPTKNLKKVMQNNDLYKYSCLDIAIKKKIDVLGYLNLYRKYPKIEMMMKLNCTNFIKSIAHSYYYLGYENELNKIEKKDMNVLKKYDYTVEQYKVYKKFNIVEPVLINKARSVNALNIVNIPIPPNIKTVFYKKIERIINYLYQKEYSIIDYKDYLKNCELLGMDISDKKVLFPSDPKAAHDEVESKFQNNRIAINNKRIFEYAKELKKYIYVENKLIIRPTQSQDELINESRELHHCVRTYADNVANKETAIMFIRKKNEPNKPYVTLELQNKTVIQCRACDNHVPERSVINFVNRWCEINHFRSCFNAQ
ncbi:PcfJ domain-containing protein [Coprobacillus sp. AF33-1AC]|uniref:PcfJ domain-containing protein n=1 Tax=Coprobacillus sp. AF33-1AC TaxID=2292032 RepID=UPI001313D946|nr:PcfJ domain-containing protein [Coprobacillus sp. AF33-1AC]